HGEGDEPRGWVEDLNRADREVPREQSDLVGSGLPARLEGRHRGDRDAPGWRGAAVGGGRAGGERGPRAAPGGGGRALSHLVGGGCAQAVPQGGARGLLHVGHEEPRAGVGGGRVVHRILRRTPIWLNVSDCFSRSVSTTSSPWWVRMRRIASNGPGPNDASTG